MIRAVVLVVVVCTALTSNACGPRPDNSKVKLPAPVRSTTLGPGDIFSMQIVGEKDLPTEYQVASDGSVDIPFIHRLDVSGLEPQEVARIVREALIHKKILMDPSVVVRVQEYRSKRISILGQVQKPGSFPLTPGLTLVQAISSAGGLTAIGNRDRITLTRRTDDRTVTVRISISAITDGRSPDIPLQAGDQIFVSQRVF